MPSRSWVRLYYYVDMHAFYFSKQLLGNKYLPIAFILVVIGLLFQSVHGLLLPDRLQDTITLTLGILYEAMPFVFLGVLLSVIIQKYVPQSFIIKILPNNSFLRRIILSLFGVFLPVCECGNVPLARGLLMKGLKPAEVMTFLFAAPIINPVTIYTTSQAFQNDTSIVIIRVIAAFLITNSIGYIYSKQKQSQILQSDFVAHCEAHAKNIHNGKITITQKWRDFSQSFKQETLALMPALVGGSIVAGLVQTVIPRSFLVALTSQPVLAILALMLLAFIISICANVDAFFALSLSSVFPKSAIVAFLVFGPMVDIKMIALLKTTFTIRIILYSSALIFMMSFITGLLVQYAF